MRAEAPQGYLTSTQVAELLGIPAKAFRISRATTYSWLPAPLVVQRCQGASNLRYYWEETETRAAITTGRTRYARGWHPVPEVSPPVSVFIHQTGQRPAKVRIDTLPNTDEVEDFIGDWLTELEDVLAQHFGTHGYIDSPSPCVPGTYALIRA